MVHLEERDGWIYANNIENLTVCKVETTIQDEW